MLLLFIQQMSSSSGIYHCQYVKYYLLIDSADIDECLGNPCLNGGICKNRPGGFDCPCKPGMKDDGKGGTCTDIFPSAAKAAVGKLRLLHCTLSFFFLVSHVVLQPECTGKISTGWVRSVPVESISHHENPPVANLIKSSTYYV
jgi:hypothetical protein